MAVADPGNDSAVADLVVLVTAAPVPVDRKTAGRKTVVHGKVVPAPMVDPVRVTILRPETAHPKMVTRKADRKFCEL